jgi:hypothetical protein
VEKERAPPYRHGCVVAQCVEAEREPREPAGRGEVAVEEHDPPRRRGGRSEVERRVGDALLPGAAERDERHVERRAQPRLDRLLQHLRRRVGARRDEQQQRRAAVGIREQRLETRGRRLSERRAERRADKVGGGARQRLRAQRRAQEQPTKRTDALAW